MKKMLCILFTTVLLLSGLSIISTSSKNLNEKNFILSSLPMMSCESNAQFTSTFLGGSSNDGDYYTGNNIAIDRNGDIFVAGTTLSANFPITPEAFTTGYRGNTDIFITKIKPDLSEVVASTIIGGTGKDEVRGIIIDISSDNIYVAGITESSDFPTTQNAFQQSYNGGTNHPYGSGDAFVMKLNNDLSTLLSSTFLGGEGPECCNAMHVNPAGLIYVSGCTSSTDFPTTSEAYDRTINTGGYFGNDVYISAFSSDLSNLVASTYIGGNSDDFCEQLFINQNGDIYIGGWTASNDYPTSPRAYDTTFGLGYYDAFISSFTHDLSTLVASTYVGGGAWDFCYGLTGDNTGEIYITGHTASTNFPVTAGAYCDEYQGDGGPDIGDDVFISRFDANLNQLIASTYIGGGAWENGFSIIVGDGSYVYVSGTTSSDDYPTTLNVLDDTYGGGVKNKGDVFISRLSTALDTLSSSTYIGAIGNEGMGQIAFDYLGDIYVAGSTGSTNFIVTNGSYDTEYNGGSADTFIVHIDSSLSKMRPDAPSRPEGPTAGKIGQQCEYTSMTTDPNGDMLFYLFDWGDGTMSEWLGPYNSGNPCTASYTWYNQGSYNIRVMAKNTQGFESDWSDPLPVSVPKPYERPVWQLFEKILVWLEQLFSKSMF